MAKRGPKPKIGEKERAEIFACLTVGASLRDAADYLRIDYKTIYNLRRKDPEFSNGVMQAIKAGKLLHLRKVGEAPQWQAHAFMLERRWGREFGRREHVKQEVTGKGGGPIQTEQRMIFDFDDFTNNFNAFARLPDTRRNGSPLPSGNGH